MERLYCLLVTASLLLCLLFVVSCVLTIMFDAVAIILCIYTNTSYANVIVFYVLNIIVHALESMSYYVHTSLYQGKLYYCMCYHRYIGCR